MLKIVVLLLTLLCLLPNSEADFFGYYLDYFGLRDRYIPFINDDMDAINKYKGKYHW
uniref:Uncharacterized protein n=1 Tax=Mesocestoides corti TaxID=53468 RepID=A0A5K3FN59_MESCO